MKFIPLCLLITVVGLQSFSSKALTIPLEVSTTSYDTKTIQLVDFQKISVAQGIEVTLVKGNTNKAEVTSNYLDQVEVAVENGNLRVQYVKNRSYTLRNAKTQIKLTTKIIPNHLSVSSSGKLVVSDALVANELWVAVSSSGDLIFSNLVQSKNANIKVSSSGSLNIPLKCDEVDMEVSSSGDVTSAVNANQMSLQLSSSADVQVVGNIEKMDVKASSSAEINASKLKVGTVNFDGSSSAEARFGNITQKLMVNASSGAEVSYHSDSAALQVTKRTSSGASVSVY